MIKGLYPAFEKLNKWDNIWIMSDPHYGEGEWKVYDTYSSDERVAILNQFAHKKDCVICLGDVGDPSYVAKWKAGYKILIKGNHDAGNANYAGYFDEIYEGPVFISERLLLSHEPIDLPFAFNIHGHDHHGDSNIGLNLCGNLTCFQPINLKWLIEGGALRHIDSIHRETIDRATERKKWRNRK